ncbi:ankyrin repeat [Cedratvirus lausannensis]|uniref:Ankyrin repeat n=1 Tax=Cedratvirus lausannensis TaxID=2023205 RepID=A0A285PWP2_9VIRU|nr:ankyrin repeat [Cedratvirus lausannensis]
MDLLNEQVLCTIFSFSEGYNFVNRQVCSDFRRIVPKVSPFVYLDRLLADKVQIKLEPSEEMMVEAVKLDLVHLLEVNKPYIEKEICEIAAELGKTKVLDWAIDNGYSCIHPTPCTGPCKSSNLYCCAVKGGHLHIIKQLDEKGFPFRVSNFYDVAKYGHWEILKWVKDRGYLSERFCSNAALGGRLDILQWLRANGCDWDVWVCADAALGGHLEVLKWARANGCPWDTWTCRNAAAGGHLEVLQWARSQGCPWNENTCAYAAGSGHLEILQWLRANGCPWDQETCYSAATGGCLETLKWAFENGCPWTNNACVTAYMNNRTNIIEWMKENGLFHIESHE